MYFTQPIITIWQREIIRYTRDKGRIFVTLFQPLMFFAIFGAGFRQTLASGNLGVDFIQFMFPGIVAMSLMGVAIFSTISTVWDREFGFLKEILVAPVSRTSIAIGKTLSATTIASLQALVLLVIAPFIGIKLHIAIFPYLFLFMLLLSFSVAALGMLIASLIKSIENFGVIMNVIVFPMFFLSGAFFPLTEVPGWMSALSKINPLTYGVDAMRQIILAPQVPEQILSRLVLHPIFTDAMFLLGFAAIMILAAVTAFNKE